MGRGQRARQHPGGRQVTDRERILVIGADAAGMSAAHQALRLGRAQGRDLDVLALEATEYTSYSACGLPYWVAGTVGDYDELVARSPEQHRAMGVDLRTGTRATRLDLDRREVEFVSTSGETGREGFDQVVIATGASPILPAWATRDGRRIDGVRAAKNVTDAQGWIDRWAAQGTGPAGADEGRNRVVVVGAGYIGLELAEAAQDHGFEVVLIARSRVMSNLDPEMSERIAMKMAATGVRVISGVNVDGLEVDARGEVAALVTSVGERIATRHVIVATGIRPALDYLDGTGLERGPSGGLRPEPSGRLADGVYAAGDCVETRHRISGEWVYLPLGTHANKQGRVVGSNLVGGHEEFAGVLGTAITRFGSGDAVVEISRTGLSLADAQRAGFDAVALVTEGNTASGYMPEASPIAVNVIADRASRRLLGAQIVGGPRSAKRIDTMAAALWGNMRVDDLAQMDLAYAPPFATVWEIVQLAARRVGDRL